MKTSTKLLTILLAFSLFAMIGSDLTLKAKFDKIDRNDPFADYIKNSMKPFKYVKLTGNFFGVTQIQPGKAFEVRIQKILNDTKNPEITSKVDGDTLFVNFKTDNKKFSFNSDSYNWPSQVYIIAPALSGVTSNGITCKVQGWKNGTFSSVQKENGVLFDDNHFDKLSINSQSGSYTKIKTNNVLGETMVVIKDSSSIVVDKDIFKSFKMNIDSSAHVSLPGSLL